METKCCGTCKRWLYVHPIEDYICDKGAAAHIKDSLRAEMEKA